MCRVFLLGKVQWLWFPGNLMDSEFVFMDRISWHRQVAKAVRFSGLVISFLLSWGDTVLLVSSNSDPQFWLGQFAVECSPWIREGPCPNWKTLTIWESCSRVEWKWSQRRTDGLVKRLQWCGHCTGLLCWRENWAVRQRSQLTCLSFFQTSSMVSGCG